MRKLLTAVIFGLILATLGLSPASAQDPDMPDTIWVSRIPMTETITSIGWPKTFALTCSISTDQLIYEARVPLTFYHSQNLDIFLDSANVITGFTLAFTNDSVTYSDPESPAPKSMKFFGFYSLPPGKHQLFKAYFNSDYLQALNWDTTKGIVIDPVKYTFEDSLFLSDLSNNWIPVFRQGLIGGAVTIEGQVFKPDGVTPDTGARVYFRGKDRWSISVEDTFLIAGRHGMVKTDSLGIYQITVGKDAYWCVFRDTTFEMRDSVNTYCFDSLTSDTFGIDFYGKYLKGEGVVIGGIAYTKNPPNPEKNKKIYLSGTITDTIRTDNSGYYEYNVLKGGSYCVRTTATFTPSKAYCFTNLMKDALNNDFEGDTLGGYIFLSGTVYQTPPITWANQWIYLSGQVRSDLFVEDSVLSDSVGNYKFRVVKGGWEYNICMDGAGCTNPATSYTFNYLRKDTSYNVFMSPGIPGGRITISGVVYFEAGLPWSDETVYLYEYESGIQISRTDSTLTDEMGIYQFNVLMGKKYCVFMDISKGMYCFDPLLTDTSGINFKPPKVEVEEEEEAVPENFALFQNYPNPFNPYTTIRFALPRDCEVKLEVYNIVGQKVRTLAFGFFPKGVRQMEWDGKNQNGEDVSTGIYFYKIEAEEYSDIKTMVLLR
ncbi:MAG: hypothetical protein AMJ90_02500 [candidate division Zixibacteria bacterium SM23_73_2]|nr:MAG: hypothetical protein AMJ90_02500 [candidate division Zixibacteria bacterium SM23_73_2]